jgi:hypothetical protein
VNLQCRVNAAFIQNFKIKKCRMHNFQKFIKLKRHWTYEKFDTHFFVQIILGLNINHTHTRMSINYYRKYLRLCKAISIIMIKVSLTFPLFCLLQKHFCSTAISDYFCNWECIANNNLSEELLSKYFFCKRKMQKKNISYFL